MKTKLFLAAALAAFTMASCVKEAGEDNVVPVPMDQDATVSLSISNPRTKAIDNLQEGEKIEDLMLLFVDGAGNILNNYYVNTTSDPSIADLEGSSALTKGDREFSTKTNTLYVYAIANLGARAQYFTADILGTTDPGDGKAITAKTIDAVKADAKINLSTHEMNGLGLGGAVTPTVGFPATGTSALLTWVANGNSDNTMYGATAEVQLVLLPVRFDVTVENNMTNQNAADAYEVTEVAVLYSAYETYLFEHSTGAAGQKYVLPFSYKTPTANYYRSGLADWVKLDEANTAAGFAAGTSISSQDAKLRAAWNGATPFGQTFYIYNSITPTKIAPDTSVPSAWVNKSPIITIKAQRKVTTTDVMYFSVIMNAQNDMREMLDGNNNPVTNQWTKNGHRYYVNIKLTGNAETHPGGTTDPEIGVSPGALEVQIKAAGWVAGGTIDKEIK